MLFLRTDFINVTSFNVAWHSQVGQGPRAHNPWTEENTFCTQVRYGIPVVGTSLNCPNWRKRVAVGCNSNSTNNSHLSFQRLIQNADLLFRKEKSQTNIPTKSPLCTRGGEKKEEAETLERNSHQLPVHINCKLQKANQRFKFGESFHCGIVESFEKSSRFKCRNMTRQSIFLNPVAPPLQAFKSCGSVSTPVITGALNRCYFRSVSDLALEPFFAKAHCA